MSRFQLNITKEQKKSQLEWEKKNSIDKNTEMAMMLELSDKDFMIDRNLS